MGEREVTLDATEDGGSFSGMQSGQQRSSEISDGTVDGDAVTWQVTIDAPMGEMVRSFSGSIDGDSSSGDVQFGLFGSGTFAGKRVASPPMRIPETALRRAPAMQCLGVQNWVVRGGPPRGWRAFGQPQAHDPHIVKTATTRVSA